MSYQRRHGARRRGGWQGRSQTSNPVGRPIGAPTRSTMEDSVNRGEDAAPAQNFDGRAGSGETSRLGSPNGGTSSDPKPDTKKARKDPPAS